MLKHLVHSHHGKLHTFDDFYRNDSKPIKLRSVPNDLASTTNNNSSSPSSSTCPSSPNNNSYTFYNVFSDFKSKTTPDVVLEEDESEEIVAQESNPVTPVFYLEDEHHNPPQTSSPSPHWPSLILNRFRHANNHQNGMIKQNSINENQMVSTKLRKSDLVDSSTSRHRFLKRSQTINHTTGLTDKKSSPNDDFPELSLPTTNDIVKKHRSFASVFHHFHNHHQTFSTKNSNKSKSTGALHTENINTNTNEVLHRKPIRQRTLPCSNSEKSSPVNKSPQAPVLPKLVSLFHRHYLSEQHKYRVGNLKARLHHRRNSPPLTNSAPKFQCQVSNELIQQIKQSEEQEYGDNHYTRFQRSVKPVVMKRVHTWHNTFNLRPVDQCLEY